MSLYVVSGVNDGLRVVMGDIAAPASRVSFVNESSIPGGIAGQRLGIGDESNIIAVVKQGELIDTVMGESVTVLVPVTGINGITYTQEVTYINTGQGQEGLQTVGAKPEATDDYSDTSVPASSESEVAATAVNDDEFVDETVPYEDPGATVYYVDGEYVDASATPTPVYDPTQDPYYDPDQDPNYYDETANR